MKLFGRWRIPGICVTPYCLSLRESGSKYPCCEHHGRFARSIEYSASDAYADFLTDLEVAKATIMELACDPADSAGASYWRDYAKYMRESKERIKARHSPDQHPLKP
jgi:hypothetical protein